jgi:hypothetical protein
MFLADEIEALIALGQLDRAARLVDMLDEAGTRLQRDWALVQAGRCRALLLGARGDLDRAAQAAHEALTVGENCELRLELARTLLVAGQTDCRRRRKGAARELLEQALKGSRGSTSSWCTRCRTTWPTIGRSGGRSTSRSSRRCSPRVVAVTRSNSSCG